jgi:hypothetical protein
LCIKIKNFEEYLKTGKGVTGWTVGQCVKAEDIFGTDIT